MIISIVVILVALLLVVLLTPLPKKGGGNVSASSSVRGQDGRLIGACLGDARKAEGLIMYELKRQPGLSRAGAVQSAIERLESDRR